MEALMLPEEWLVGNVLTATDLYANDDLYGYADDLVEGDYIKPETTETNKQVFELPDDGINNDLSWLDDATCIAHLDASLQPSILEDVSADPVADILAELEAVYPPEENAIVGSFETQAKFMIDKPLPDESFQAPCSPVEISLFSNFPAEPMVKYLQPSTIDISGLKSQAQVVMDDLNVLHLPETQNDTTQLILEALADPNAAAQLNVTEVESILSDSPPSSPEALVPRSPCPDTDEDYSPPKKRRSHSGGRTKGRKSLKPDEKRERKKAQNKNAATKYRNKKRNEENSFKHEYEQLETKNAALKRKVEDLSSEIKYMKDLLNDALKGKGLRIK